MSRRSQRPIRGPYLISRRRLLATALAAGTGVVLIACGDDGDDAALAEAVDRPVQAPSTEAPAEQPAAGTEPGAAPEAQAAGATEPAAEQAQAAVGPAESSPEVLPLAPLAYVVPREMRQGTAFLVAVDAPGAGFASAAFDGQVFTMLREGPRFYTILGVDALAPVGPTPLIVSVSDATGVPVLRQETLITINAANWVVEVVELDESNQELLDPLIRFEDETARQPHVRTETPERLWDGLFDPPSIGVITSGYGLLRSYNQQTPEEYHSGIDFAGENGDPIVAPNVGVAAWTGKTRRRGNGLIIDHGGGVFSGYYHMSEVGVEPGDLIERGDFIGRIGATGLATGPHLHWEIVVHGITVDPVQWMRIIEIPDPTEQFDPANALQAPNQVRA